MYLERQNQAVEDVNEEVVENGSDNESEGGSDVPVMGIENNVVMVDSVLDSVRDGSIEANAKLNNVGVSEAEGVDNVFMEASVPNEAIAEKDGVRGNELGSDCVFDAVKEKNELKDEGVTQQCLADKSFSKENDVMDNKESGDFEMQDINDESKSQGATDENKKDFVLNEKDESKSQVVGTTSETARDDDSSVPC